MAVNSSNSSFNMNKTVLLASQSGNTGVAAKTASPNPPIKKPKVSKGKGGGEDGVSLSSRAAETQLHQEMAEKGDLQELNHRAGNHIGGNEEHEENKTEGEERARELLVPEGGRKVTTPQGEDFVMNKEQVHEYDKKFGPEQLDDDQFAKLMHPFNEGQVGAAEKVFENQAAGGIGKVAKLKEAPSEIALETARPVLETVPTTGPIDIGGAEKHTMNAPQSIPSAYPPETEQTAAAAIAAGAVGVAAAGAAAPAEKTEKTAAPAPQRIMDPAQAKMLLEMSQKGLSQSNVNLAQSVTHEGIVTDAKNSRESMVKRGMSPAQARQTIGMHLQMNGKAVNDAFGKEAQRAIFQQCSEKAADAKAEAKAKGIPLSDNDAMLVGQIRAQNQNLGYLAQNNKLEKLMGPDSGIPSARDLIKKHTDENGQFDANAFTQEYGKVIIDKSPGVMQRMQDLQTQAQAAKDPAEREKLLGQAEELNQHFIGYHDGYHCGNIIGNAQNSLIAQELVKSDGFSNSPKSLSLLDNGAPQVDKDSNDQARQLSRSNQAWDAQNQVLQNHPNKQLFDKDVLSDAGTTREKNHKAMVAGDSSGGKISPEEYGFLSDASALASAATSQLSRIDVNSPDGKALAASAQSGFSYLQSRETFLNSQASDALKNNPAFQSAKGEWAQAQAQLAKLLGT